MKKIICSVLCLFVASLLGFAQNQKEGDSSLRIINSCNENITVCVSDLPVDGYGDAQLVTFADETVIKPDESFSLSAKLDEGHSFLLGVKSGSSWNWHIVDRGYKDVEVKKGGEDKYKICLYKNLGEIGEHSIRISNSWNKDITICVGYVPKTENGYDFYSSDLGSFVDDKIIKPGKSIDVSGKFYEGYSFLVGVKTDGRNYMTWPVDTVYKSMSVRKTAEGEFCIGVYRLIGAEKKYSFEIQNATDKEIRFFVGHVLKTDDGYDFSNWTEAEEKTIKPNGKITVSGKVCDGYTFGVAAPLDDGSGRSSTVGVELDFTNISCFTSEDGILRYQYYKTDAKSKLPKGNGALPLTIKNETDKPLVVSVGDAPKDFDWDFVNEDSFLDNTLLKPGKSITVYGKFSDDRVFFVCAAKLDGKEEFWVTESSQTILAEKDGELVLH